jgi:hypothetical protein
MGVTAALANELSWRRFAVVVALCLVVSTEILFQPSLYQYRDVAAIWRGWIDFFLEVLLCGVAMWIAVGCVEALLPEGRMRDAALALAVLGGAAMGYTMATLWLQPAGFYPPPLNMSGDILRWALFGGVITLAYTHMKRAASAAARLDETRIDRASLGRQMVEAQLQVLQAQIEPHFLFNTLAHVRRLYEVAPGTGGEMLASLRHYLRAALPQMRESGSTLARETQLVRAYLCVLRIRMGTRLGFSIEVPDALRDHAFPPMMLITLVENAIKHGLQPRPEGGSIAITVVGGDGVIDVEVADTGVGFRELTGTGVGLANTRERLRAVYGDGASLRLARNHPCGVVACVRIPMTAPA